MTSFTESPAVNGLNTERLETGESSFSGGRGKSERRRWDQRRSAWLGCLVALGRTPEQIAGHDEIRSTADSVTRQANRVGLMFRDFTPDVVAADHMQVFKEVGLEIGLSGETLLRRVLNQLAENRDWIKNVVNFR